VEQDSIERIRSATFTVARRGYEPREVEQFLNQIADWLETGGGDQARADVVRREIERVGEKTAKILSSAEDTAQQLRADAEQEAGRMVERAQEEAERRRKGANDYAAKTRQEADAYASKQRGDADGYAAKTRGAADSFAKETRGAAEADAERKQATADHRADEVVAAAEAKAKRIVDEGVKRRREIEVTISDLVARRDAVISDAGRLAQELTAVADAHQPKEGADRFATPKELDPKARGETAAAASVKRKSTQQVEA
jgi:DivIVA domain-containing protein